MARIKAKPMNRLPIASTLPIPNKNGYRVTPPPPAVYDPATAYANANHHQRFVYANGTGLPQGTVPYTGQMVFVSRCKVFVFVLSN